jgi:hypothetical protein
MEFKATVQPVLLQLTAALQQLTNIQYAQKSNWLNSSTIGGHTRHIIELFQCLYNGYDEGVVNYENRKRDILIETNLELACSLLIKIGSVIDLPNKKLQLGCLWGGNNLSTVETNYYREVMYNLEHTIHHMALIRVGILEVSNVQLPENFGVASSTIQYKKVCAQ